MSPSTSPRPFTPALRYREAEILWNARFKSMFQPADKDGVISVDIRLLNELNPS